MNKYRIYIRYDNKIDLPRIEIVRLEAYNKEDACKLVNNTNTDLQYGEIINCELIEKVK